LAFNRRNIINSLKYLASYSRKINHLEVMVLFPPVVALINYVSHEKSQVDSAIASLEA
jgi:hypothetical protein